MDEDDKQVEEKGVIMGGGEDKEEDLIKISKK